MLFGSLYGRIYTQGLEDLAGRHFNYNLIVFEGQTSVNYLVADELKDYCTHLTDLIKDDLMFPQRLSDQVINNTDKIFALMKALNLKNEFLQSDFTKLQQARLIITTANFSLKKVIDYLPADLREKHLELFTKVRLYTEPVYNETDRLLRKIAQTILKNKLPNELCAVLTNQEMETYFINGILPNANDLAERMDGCAILYDFFGHGTACTGSAYRNLLSAITNKISISTDEIKGTAAFRGIARGKVRIVLDPQKCQDFQVGEILVTGMTRPEYLSLMKKSTAFITDAGGLLSHAAIVARELKKPCIIGTEIATKVLKDGDQVEVDADKGVVRKLDKRV